MRTLAATLSPPKTQPPFQLRSFGNARTELISSFRAENNQLRCLALTWPGVARPRPRLRSARVGNGIALGGRGSAVAFSHRKIAGDRQEGVSASSGWCRKFFTDGPQVEAGFVPGRTFGDVSGNSLISSTRQSAPGR